MGQSLIALNSQQKRARILHLRYPNERRYSGSQLRRSKSKSSSVIKGSKEMQDQGLSGYSSAPLTSSVPTETRQVSAVMDMTWFSLFRLSACSESGRHRHASSSFVSVQTRTAQS